MDSTYIIALPILKMIEFYKKKQFKNFSFLLKKILGIIEIRIIALKYSSKLTAKYGKIT
jgi:hypothetical protein